MANLVRVFGNDFPVMKALGDDWYLVAHENGPAITTTEFGFLAVLSRPCEEIPEEIRRKAIEAFVDLAWPTTKPIWFAGS